MALGGHVHRLRRQFQMCLSGDSRGGDDLISGSPDEQDWSLVSGGKTGNELHHPGFCTNPINAGAVDFGRHLQRNSLQELVHVVEVHVLAHRVLHQRPCKTTATAQQPKESCVTAPRIAVGLTPAVRHDLESQRQKVIKGRVQHHCFDLWV